MIEEVVALAESLTPVALIGAGGIGKTSIALSVLHHNRVKQRFGENRRFIRCDQFPATLAHLLDRLSKVTGAGVEHPEDLTPLRPFLSSSKMIIVLDNAESILDPQGTDAQAIYAVVGELSRFNNIWICITSRISTTPPEYKCLDVSTLSAGAARDTFYSVYGSRSDGRSNLVNGILDQLDFHPLSITLLAAVARQNKWDTDRLAGEWERRRTSVLETRHKKSLAAAIELSLASPMFQEFGPDGRALLGVVAFFPQGVDENNVDWLFPTISNGTHILDGFCTLSLTYRSNGFITMLAPLRDYLSPEDPKLSPLLCTVKERYFTRISVDFDPDRPDFRKTRWITSEDINVEHLLDVFTTVDANSDDIWKACANFMQHLVWHKRRLTVLKPKIEGLSDDHRWKPKCSFMLSRLLGSIENHMECKRILTHTLEFERERGDDHEVAQTLWLLADTNRRMGLSKEGTDQVKEALEIFERLGHMAGQVQCLMLIAWLSREAKQLDAAEETASRAISLIPEKDNQLLVCESHLVLGEIYRVKGEASKAIHHFEVALGIASLFSWHEEQLHIHYPLAMLFLDERRFDEAHAHAGRARSYLVNSAYDLGGVMVLQASIWYEQRELEEARSEILRATDVFEKVGAADGIETCGMFLQLIQGRMNSLVVSGQLREFLQSVPLPARIDLPL